MSLFSNASRAWVNEMDNTQEKDWRSIGKDWKSIEKDYLENFVLF